MASHKCLFRRTEPSDDALSFLITMGSPSLAAYSLQITHLNKYWIHRAFLGVKYPNSKLVPTALAAFHHIPIRIEQQPPFLHSLIVLPNNDGFWSHLAAANKTRRWSIPLVMSYVLVIFSVILTTIDSIVSGPGVTGYGIAAVWTFLLPLVIGWLHVGCEPEPSHLRRSLTAANQNSWVATGCRDHPETTNITAVEFAEAGTVDLARKDELKPVPVFNYSRAFVTPMTAEVVLRLMKTAAANAKHKIPVSGSVGGGVSVWVDGEDGEILPENRVGTTAEVTEYCTRVLQQPERNRDSIAPLDIQPPEMTDTAYPPLENGLITPSRWAPGIWRRVVIASILALMLQWGTAGAAVFIHYKSPPVGLGCRSLSFLLYAAMGTLSFFLFLASSILAHMSWPLPGRVPTRSRSHTRCTAGAIICRWLGKFVAIISAIEILSICFLNVTGAFDSCFCNSTTFDRGRQLVFINEMHTVPGPGIIGFWVCGLVMAFFTAILFGLSMYMGLPPRRYE